jgi:lipid-binding SYLF domain-containing protein
MYRWRTNSSQMIGVELAEAMVVLCKQNGLLLVAAERFNTITNSSHVGVGSSPAGRYARLCTLGTSELPRH